MKKIQIILASLMLISCSNDLDEIISESTSVKTLTSKREIRSVKQARQIAVNYLNARNRFTGRRHIQGNGQTDEMQVDVITSQMLNSTDSVGSSNDNDTLMYSVRTGSSAVLVPAFSEAASVFAEIEDPNFSIASIVSPNSETENPLAHLIVPALDPDYWDIFKPWTDWQGPFGEKLEIVESVHPKVQVEWDQREPFNKFCPEGCVAGCVAIATAQALTVTRNLSKIKGLELNYDNLIKVKNYYYTFNNRQITDTIAMLIRYIGDAVDMKYGETSSANTKKAVQTFFTPTMTVSTDARYVRRALNRDRGIVIVSSRNKKDFLFFSRGDGHAYIIDGYYIYNNEDSFVHVNFGWREGSCGYFMKNIFNPNFVENAPDKFPYEMDFFCIFPKNN